MWADLAQANVIEVPPRSTRSFDLYFSLPSRLRDPDRLPPFDVVLSVHVGPRLIARRTMFERFHENRPLTDLELVLAPPPYLDDQSEEAPALER